MYFVTSVTVRSASACLSILHASAMHFCLDRQAAHIARNYRSADMSLFNLEEIYRSPRDGYQPVAIQTNGVMGPVRVAAVHESFKRLYGHSIFLPEI